MGFLVLFFLLFLPLASICDFRDEMKIKLHFSRNPRIPGSKSIVVTPRNGTKKNSLQPGRTVIE